MSNDTHVRDFLKRMANEIDVPPLDWRSPVKRARRHRSVTMAVVVMTIVAVVVGGSVGLRSLTRTAVRPAGRPSPTSVVPGAGPGTLVDINTGAVTPLPSSITTSGAAYYAVSPDHTEIAYSACCSPPEPLFVANLDGTRIRRVTPEGQDAFGAQWSPDGLKLVYQQRDGSTLQLGNLFVLDVRTGLRTRLTDFDQSQQWGWWFTFPSFAPDRPYIFFQLPRGDPNNPAWDLWAVPDTGGTQTLVRRNAGWGGLGGHTLPRNLAYLSPIDNAGFTGGTLWITSFDLRRVTPRAMVRGGHIRWPRWSPDGTQMSYSQNGSIYVLDVSRRSTTKVAAGGSAEWFDNHTLIVGPGGH
jgi:hypothetical protein